MLMVKCGLGLRKLLGDRCIVVGIELNIYELGLL